MQNKYIKAQSITSAGWVRPAEWLPLPDFAPSDNRVVILCAVYEGLYNGYAFAGGATFSTIYWGDGTSVVSNGGYQNKIYDVSFLGAPTNHRRHFFVNKIQQLASGPLSHLNWFIKYDNNRNHDEFIKIINQSKIGLNYFPMSHLDKCGLSNE
jgi:hypothetical protein